MYHDSILKNRDITLPTKVHLVKAMVFPVVTYRLWYWRRLLSPLDCMEIQPVHLKGNQPWIFIGSTDAEAEAPIRWPHDVKSSFIGKDHDAVKDWGQEEKRVTEDETVGWHHWLDQHEFEDAPGSLACYSPWGRKELDTTGRMKWTEQNWLEHDAWEA